MIPKWTQRFLHSVLCCDLINATVKVAWWGFSVASSARASVYNQCMRPRVTVHEINWEARLNKATFLAFIIEYKATIQFKMLLVQLRRMKSRTWCLMTTMMRRTTKRSPLLNRQRRSRRSKRRGLQMFWQNTDFFFFCTRQTRFTGWVFLPHIQKNAVGV